MKTVTHVLRACKEILYYKKQNSVFLISVKLYNFRHLVKMLIMNSILICRFIIYCIKLLLFFK
jgi:hypothetical protein